MLLVLLPYEITLFSNVNGDAQAGDAVLLPYEITLFSNGEIAVYRSYSVLLPYEITLFSNIVKRINGFIKFYYLMKLHYSQTN